MKYELSPELDDLASDMIRAVEILIREPGITTNKIGPDLAEQMYINGLIENYVDFEQILRQNNSSLFCIAVPAASDEHLIGSGVWMRYPIFSRETDKPSHFLIIVDGQEAADDKLTKYEIQPEDNIINLMTCAKLVLPKFQSKMNMN